MRENEPRLTAFPRGPVADGPRHSEPRRRLWRRLLPRRLTDALAALIAATAVIAVLVNALALQSPPAARPSGSKQSDQQGNVRRVVTVPITTPRPASYSTPMPPQRPGVAPRNRTELILEIQRELIKRGLYGGSADGVLGPRSVRAIREFEQSQGMQVTGEPSDALLDRLRRAAGVPEVTGSIGGPDARVRRVQRTLADFGYGPVRITGEHDALTRAAIERFEHDRRLPMTGEISSRLLRELATLTGSAVE